jgi:hypothetical protein
LSVTGGNYYGYLWSTGAVTSTISVIAAGTYTVTVFDNCASATATTTLTSIPSPTASVTPGSESVCAGSLVTLTASGGGTYRWSVGSTTASINVSPTVTKTYTVTVTAANSCTASASTTLTPASGATASILPAAVTMCSGNDTTLIASGGSTYLWSNSATTSSISVSPSSTTTYSVTASNGNCSASASRTVDITSLAAVVTANGPISLCSGGSVTLTVNSFSSYLWNTGATTQSIVVTQTGAYSCTVTNSTGCSGTSNVVNVTISSGNLTPVIAASNSLNLCPGGETTLDAGAGYDTYNWNVGVGSETIEVSNTITGSYNYTVTVTQGACTGSASATVNIANTPVNVSVSPPNPVSVCAGTQVTLNAGAGYHSYAWSNNDTGETIQPSADGNYYVTVTQNNACTGTTGVSVAFTPLPAVSITPPDTQNICSGQSVTLDAGPGFDGYIWSTGDTTQTIGVYFSGNYSVVVSRNGCQALSDTVNVNVIPAITPVIIPIGNQTICSGQNIILSADTSYGSYLWSNGATTQTIAVYSAGTYNLSITQNGCPGTAFGAVNVAVNSTPEATLVAQTIDTDYVILQAGPASANFQWLLQLSSGNDSLLSNMQQYDTAVCGGEGTYYQVIATENGCSDTSAPVEALCSGLPSGINNMSVLTNFEIQPNPASDVLHVMYSLHQNANVQISVLDMMGRTAMKVKDETQGRGNYTVQINLHSLSSGIYLLRMVTDSGSFNTKFVKQ